MLMPDYAPNSHAVGAGLKPALSPWGAGLGNVVPC